MWTKFSVMGVAALAGAQASAQSEQTNIQLLAQAQDRCMATYAVRLTKTAADDEAIFVQATRGCAPIMQQLSAQIVAQIPKDKATQVLASLDARAKPDFMALLARIRSDRARAASQP